MSALQAARQSILEHSGLDQDPVIEGFGVYETHTPQTADSNQWFTDWQLTRVSVMSKSHCAHTHTHTCPSMLNSLKLHISGQGFS